MQGYDQDWVEQGAMASAPCRGCRPAATSSRCRQRPPGAWTPSQQLQVKVLPPWWRSGMAIFGYILLGSLLLVVLVWSVARGCAVASNGS